MNKFLNIPNSLTILRISLIPIFVITFYLPWKWHYIASTLVFILASLTDYLDGYLARKLQQESAFGTFLDPVADKLIIAVALILLVEEHATRWFSIPAAVIVGREIVVSALREWMAEVGKRTNVAVSYLGKLKTSLQMLAIVMLLAIPPDFGKIMIIAYGSLYMAVILTIWSMIVYLWAARKNF
ncbi:MAG: CDP-diacylglycerol--glycerol-3-phosphate 3-phosphatidyltransferase [Gammaproteobacteria bacterium]|jgi:CDP-diacylglycerol--glycerol-3-phosphate 3-phosphatidyltransferase